jgi:hypothetical protein
LDAPEEDESKNDNSEDPFDEEAMRAEAEKPWNEDDLDRLSLYFERKMDITRIAERLGKSIYSVQYQLSKLGLMSMPLNVDVKNSDTGGVIVNQSGKVIYQDDAQLKILNNKIYRFNLKSKCFTVKSISREEGEWVKGTKLLVAYYDSPLYPNLSKENFINEIEDFAEGKTREENKIKVNGVWYDYYGDILA